jgi:hypothetical protein
MPPGAPSTMKMAGSNDFNRSATEVATTTAFSEQRIKNRRKYE